MATLPTRQLGKDGPQVTAQGYGCMGLSAFYGTKLPDKERFALLDAVYASGERFFDSADIYGDSEELLGEWFRQDPSRRPSVTLATKYAVAVGSDGSRRIRNDPEYIREACARSLQRLGVDQIDLYYCHRLNGDVPVEVVVGTMAELVKEGKIKHIGLSECSAATLRRACAVHHVAAVQVEYSPWSMEVESNGLLEACRELGVALVAYSPLGRGFLTGRFRSHADIPDGDFRKTNPRFSEENFASNLAVVDTLQAIASKKGISAGQLTLSWLMRQSPEVIPIPGTTNLKNLEDNIGALKVQLTDEENSEIRKVIDNSQIKGERYNAGGSTALYMDTAPYVPGKVTWAADGVAL